MRLAELPDFKTLIALSSRELSVPEAWIEKDYYLTEVLPAAGDRAKDLGLINIANSLPQVLAPAIAAPVVTHLGGYSVLYTIAAALGLAGAVLVFRIRGVR